MLYIYNVLKITVGSQDRDISILKVATYLFDLVYMSQYIFLQPFQGVNC